MRGRGLDVELGGAVHIGGTTDKPDVDGAFKLRHGALDIVGKRLEFTEGQLTFEGGEQIDPYLDLTAETRATDINRDRQGRRSRPPAAHHAVIGARHAGG